MNESKPVAWQWLDTATFRKSVPASSNPSEWTPLYAHPAPDAKPVGKFAQFTDGVWREVTKGSPGVPLYEHQPAADVQPVVDTVIAGVLFDLMGWLTSREERLMLSSADDASPAVKVLREFAEMRSLSLDNTPLIKDWQNFVYVQEPAPEDTTLFQELLNLLGPTTPTCCGCKAEWQTAIDLIKKELE